MVVRITFVAPNFSKTVEASVGDTLLEVAHKNSVPLEGACEGGMTCGTCHVTMDQKWYDGLKEDQEASDQEEDVLDEAPTPPTKTSRLGCQIKVADYMDGMSVCIPCPCRNDRWS